MFMGMLVSLPLNVPALSSAWLRPARSYSVATSFFDMADRSAYQPAAANCSPSRDGSVMNTSTSSLRAFMTVTSRWRICCSW